MELASVENDSSAGGIKYKIIPYLCKYIHIFHDVHEDEVELSLFTNNIYKLLNI